MPLKRLRSTARRFTTGVRKAFRRQGFDKEFDAEAVSPKWKRGNVTVESGKAVVQIGGRKYSIPGTRVNELIGKLKPGTEIEAIRHPMGELLLVQKIEGRKTVGQREPHIWVSAERQREVKEKKEPEKKAKERKPPKRRENRPGKSRVTIQPNWLTTTVGLPENREKGIFIYPEFEGGSKYQLRLERKIFDNSVQSVEVCIVPRTRMQRLTNAPKFVIAYVLPERGPFGFLEKPITLDSERDKFQVLKLEGRREKEIRPGRAGKKLARFVKKNGRRN